MASASLVHVYVDGEILQLLLVVGNGGELALRACLILAVLLLFNNTGTILVNFISERGVWWP